MNLKFDCYNCHKLGDIEFNSDGIAENPHFYDICPDNEEADPQDIEVYYDGTPRDFIIELTKMSKEEMKKYADVINFMRQGCIDFGN